MMSPTHMEAYDQNDYDPYNIRWSQDITQQFPPRKFVDLAIEWDETPCEERDHPLAMTANVPEYFMRKKLLKEITRMFDGIPEYGEAEIEAYTDYCTVAYQRLSIIDNV